MERLNLTNEQRNALTDGLDLFKADPSLRRSAKKRNEHSEKLSRLDNFLSYVDKEFERQRRNPNRIFHRKRFLKQKLPEDLSVDDVNFINHQLNNLKRRRVRAQRQFPFEISKTEDALNNTIIRTKTEIPQQQNGVYDMSLVRRVGENLNEYISKIATRLSRTVRRDLSGDYMAEVTIRYLLINVSESENQGQTSTRSFTPGIMIYLDKGNLKQNIQNLIQEAIRLFMIRVNEIYTPSSAWALVGIIGIDVSFNGIAIDRGRRFFELPNDYFPSRLFKNIKNIDNYCFLWCVFLQLLNNQNNEESDAKIPYDKFICRETGKEVEPFVVKSEIRADRVYSQKYYTFFYEYFLNYVNSYITNQLKQEGCYEESDDADHLFHLNNMHHIENLLNVKLFFWEYKYNYEEKDSKGLFRRTLMSTRLPEYNYETDSRKLIIDLLEVTKDEWVLERDEEDPGNKHFVIIPRVEALTNLVKNGKTCVRTLCRQCGTLLFPQFDGDRRLCLESSKVLEIHLALSKEYNELEERNINLQKDYEEAGINQDGVLNGGDDDEDILLVPSEGDHKDPRLTETMMNYLRENREHIPEDLPEGMSEYDIIHLLLRKAPERRAKRMSEIVEELGEKEIPICIKKGNIVFRQFEQKIKFDSGKVGLGKPEVFTNTVSRSLYPFTCFIDFESYQKKVENGVKDSKSLTYEYEQKPYQVGISFSCIRDEADNPKFVKLLEKYGITPFMVLSDNNSKKLTSKLLAYIIHARWVIANKIYPTYQYEPLPKLGKKLTELEKKKKKLSEKGKEELNKLQKEYDTAALKIAKTKTPDGTCFFCCRNVDDVQSELCDTAEYRVEQKKDESGDDFDFDPYKLGIGAPSYIIDNFAEEVRLACSTCHYSHTELGKNLLYDDGLIVYAHNLRGYDGKMVLKEMNPKKILEHLLELNNRETGDVEIPDQCVLGEGGKCRRKKGESRCKHCFPNVNSYSEHYKLLLNGGITDCRSKSSEKIDSFEILFNIQFKDTLEFTLCSLDAFIKNITSGKKPEELRELFYKMVHYAKSKGMKTDDDEVFTKILMSKGSFPYEFCRVTDNNTKIINLLEKQTSPPALKFYGKDLSEDDILEEWKLSNAQNLLEYSEFYCIKDVLLLEACFNHFRKQLYNHPYIGLDVARTVTLASLSRNIRLKNNIKHRSVKPLCDDDYRDRISDKTLTARDIMRYYTSFNSSVNPLDEKLYNMVNRSIKGGVSSVLQTRQFDQDLEPNKVCMQIDVNSLYPSTYLQDMPLFPKPIENGIWTLFKRVEEDNDGEEEQKEQKEKKEETVKFTFEDINESGLEYDPKKPFSEDCPLSKIEFPVNSSNTILPELDYNTCGEVTDVTKVNRVWEVREELSSTHLFINEWRLYKDYNDYQVYERHLRMRNMMFAKAGTFLMETKLRMPTDIQESIDYMRKFGYPDRIISKAIKLQKVIKKDFNNNLHEFFHTLPPFPAHKTITYDDLSDYNKEIIKHEYLKANPDKVEVTEEDLRKFRGASGKLVYSFETQDEYVLYNNFLKFLVTEMFVIPEYLYSFVEYQTGELMKEFAETLYNDRLKYKKNGNNDMQYVMKILLNSAFGRTCMDDSRYSVKREFVETEHKARARFSRDNYVDCTIIHKDLVLITSKKDAVTVSNGRHIGSFILDSAKVTLMRAVTEMRKKLGKSFETIYTDTDSLFFKIHKDKFDDLFSKDLRKYMDMGSFKPFIHLFPSKYKDKPEHPIFKVNAGKLGCFSLEDGIPRYKKVIALAAKQYLVEEWKEDDTSKRAVKSKSKGVRTGKNANPKLVTEEGEEIDFIEDPNALIDVYQSILKDKTKSYDARFDSFRSYQMQVYNVSNFKVGIKAYCDKNLIQDDGVTSYFYGQKVSV